MIEVVNRKHFRGDGIYIGRSMKGSAGSPLGNPYTVKPHGSYERGESISLYRRWLWNEIKSGTGSAFEEIRRLVELAQRRDLRLICWCKQPGANVACHGDVIQSAIEWMLTQGGDQGVAEAPTSVAADGQLPAASAKNEILYVRGDATRPRGAGAKIIVHCCNTAGAWGRGFVLALSRRWSLPEKAYRAWHRNGQFTAVINYRGKAISVPMNFTPGELLVVQVEPELFVANLTGQEGIRHNPQGKPPVRYEAIRQGLKRLRFYTDELDASVHMPRIGAGLAGGDWEVIARIIEDELCAHGIRVTIYDLAKNGQ